MPKSTRSWAFAFYSNNSRSIAYTCPKQDK